MSEQMYESPQADLNTQNPNAAIKFKRTASTVWGIIYMVLAVIGFLATLGGLAAAMSIGDGMVPHLSKDLMILDTFLAMGGKVFLFLFSLALLLRASWVKTIGIIGLVYSLIDTTFKAVAIIPKQAGAAINDAAAMGTYVGFYVLAVVSAMMYIGYLIYLKSDDSKREFNLK